MLLNFFTHSPVTTDFVFFFFFFFLVLHSQHFFPVSIVSKL